MIATDVDTWRDLARCKNHPNVDFMPANSADVPSAVAVCMKCPVAKQCYADAQAHPDKSVGVWGGTTSRQRFRLRSGRSPLPVWLR